MSKYIPPAAEKLMSDPSKFSLMNPRGGECYIATLRSEWRWNGEKKSLENVLTNMAVWILYSTMAFFALKQAIGLKTLFLNTVAFLAFQMLYNKNKNFV